MIKTISYDLIYPIWEAYLWYNRVSPITPTSAMDFMGGYDMETLKGEPTFFGYFIDNNLVGVNSGHRCRDNSYRSRGLYVHVSHRKQGIGTKLLLATIERGKIENCNYVWSYPKQSSWNTYASAGFKLSSDWMKSETGLNAYCRIDLV